MLEHSACLACYRRWEPPPPHAAAGPELLAAFHHANFGINFQSRYDHCVTCLFAWSALLLSREEVKPEVGGYGVRPLDVARIEGGRWQVNFKLPPGLEPGWHEVRLRTAESGFSNGLPIAVDVPAKTEKLTIADIRDGITWNAGEVDLGTGNLLSLWIDGLPENADRNNVRVYANQMRQAVEYLSAPEQNGLRQANFRLSDRIAPGAYNVVVRLGEAESPPVSLVVKGPAR